MAGRKKEVKAQTVTVDAYKLGQALRMTFEGVALVFDALGTDTDLDGLVKTDQIDGKDVQKEAESACDSGHGETTVDPADKSEEAAGETGLPWNGHMDLAVADKAAEEPKAVPEETSKITMDDVTKIIVQKIKKNRSNNEKIGQILKAYGVAKVGELPDTKYEAFLTDLSEL